AFADLNGDGKPDVVTVSPDGDGSIVRFFLNHGGKFEEKPDHEIELPTVSQPHKVRVATTKKGPQILVAGRSAVLLRPKGAFPKFEAAPLGLGDGNHLGYRDDAPVLAGRFGGFHALEGAKSKPTLKKLVPEIDGPYVDFRLVGDDLLTSYGRLYRRSRGGRFPKSPTRQFTLPK